MVLISVDFVDETVDLFGDGCSFFGALSEEHPEVRMEIRLSLGGHQRKNTKHAG